eukprot:CAMPEP_0117687320 /NCGR_PEP_ID=MMETSP0804-20121206/23064_1 /TAXON_ID=1074897 /ORGANISM="Tetraselmis astigmatica, Strain CCMP880" /LENGTH=33 /DNA_ID= /DNA_START= /DNA_END= /DNA_ORIENTATION=
MAHGDSQLRHMPKGSGRPLSSQGLSKYSLGFIG